MAAMKKRRCPKCGGATTVGCQVDNCPKHAEKTDTLNCKTKYHPDDVEVLSKWCCCGVESCAAFVDRANAMGCSALRFEDVAVSALDALSVSWAKRGVGLRPLAAVEEEGSLFDRYGRAEPMPAPSSRPDAYFARGPK